MHFTCRSSGSADPQRPCRGGPRRGPFHRLADGQAASRPMGIAVSSGFSFRYTEGFLKMFYLILGQATSRDCLDVDCYNKLCVNKDTKIQMPYIPELVRSRREKRSGNRFASIFRTITGRTDTSTAEAVIVCAEIFFFIDSSPFSVPAPAANSCHSQHNRQGDFRKIQNRTTDVKICSVAAMWNAVCSENSFKMFGRSSAKLLPFRKYPHSP